MPKASFYFMELTVFLVFICCHYVMGSSTTVVDRHDVSLQHTATAAMPAESIIISEVRTPKESSPKDVAALTPERTTTVSSSVQQELINSSKLPLTTFSPEGFVITEVRSPMTPPTLTGLSPEGVATRIESSLETLNGQLNKDSDMSVTNTPENSLVITEIRATLTTLTLTDLVLDGVATRMTLSPPHVQINQSDSIEFVDISPFIDTRKTSFSVGTEYCANKSLCSSEVYEKTCQCDSMCQFLRDCCEDVDIVRSAEIRPNQLTCTNIPGVTPDPAAGVIVVTKCASDWKFEETRRLCEDGITSNDLMSSVFVSDRTDTGFIYKNMHCAYCNNVYEFEYWRSSVECIDALNDMNLTDSSNCQLSFDKPNEYVSFRECDFDMHLITSTCTEKNSESELAQNCSRAAYSTVYSSSGEVYRNIYCALCNGLTEMDLYCQPIIFFAPAVVYDYEQPRLYSFRMLVDLNSKWVVNNNERFRQSFTPCKENQFYDPFSKICREVLCPPNTVPFEGICHPIPENLGVSLALYTRNPNSEVISSAGQNNVTAAPGMNCTWTKLNRREFEIENGTNNIIFQGQVYTAQEYVKNDSSVFLCMHHKQNEMTSSKVKLYQYNNIERYLSLIGLIISIIALTVTLIIYVLLPKLMNLPGKILTGLIVSLLLAQVLFLIAAETVDKSEVCLTVAVLMHFFFLCSFCWMNVMAFDLWMTFSQKFSARLRSNTSRRFLAYACYALGIPLIITSVSLIANYTADSEHNFRPGYGERVCWITSKLALLLFFAGPLAVFKLFDFIAFGFTVYHIAEAKRQGAVARDGRRISSFLINLKLSLTMGLTWAFAFIANFTNNNIIWYFFIIFNTLQGLFIGLSFLCTKRVLRLMKEKKKEISRSNTTRMTTMSRSS